MVQAHPCGFGAGAYLRALARATRLDGNACAQGLAVVPGGLDKQPARVGVAGFGDGPARVARPGLGFAWHQAQIRADRGAREPMPVADLHTQRKCGQCPDAPQAAKASDDICPAEVACHLGDLAIEQLAADPTPSTAS